MACHSLSGSAGAGPALDGLAGSSVTLADGSTVTADDEYLERAITAADAQIVKGYRAGVMPAAVAGFPPRRQDRRRARARRLHQGADVTRSRNLALATVAFALCFTAWSLIAPFAKTFKKELDLSYTGALFLTAVPVVLGSLVRIPLGYVTDRRGGRLVFPCSLPARPCRRCCSAMRTATGS